MSSSQFSEQRATHQQANPAPLNISAKTHQPGSGTWQEGRTSVTQPADRHAEAPWRLTRSKMKRPHADIVESHHPANLMRNLRTPVTRRSSGMGRTPLPPAGPPTQLLGILTSRIRETEIRHRSTFATMKFDCRWKKTDLQRGEAAAQRCHEDPSGSGPAVRVDGLVQANLGRDLLIRPERFHFKLVRQNARPEEPT